jgi:hypothetical protein
LYVHAVKILTKQVPVEAYISTEHHPVLPSFTLPEELLLLAMAAECAGILTE